MSPTLCSGTHALVSLRFLLQHSYLVISCSPSGYFLFSLRCHHNVGTTGVLQNAQKYGQAYNGVHEGPPQENCTKVER